MAEQASMYRPVKGKVGIFNSRYCSEFGKKKCTEYSYYEANACDPESWGQIVGGRFVLVPITEL